MIRLLPFLAVAFGTATAHADTGIAAHALVVGSNAAGPGQTELRYAEDDARRVGALLTELGGYTAASVDVVTHPTPTVLRDRLARLEKRVAADVAAGKQARVFFYYSGHARATAIDLGPEAMPLAELRQKLFAVNATLTVVVLDACQSGAFSRVKGAEPAADFSFNSRQQLDAKGVAVLASSTGSELSQESEQLKSSYFTHHLLVGMRGAGDANGDGQVSVDEAYRYAYHQTLVATAATAVGGQHVTLEVDLKGHGEVALSYPRAASAAIELPAALEGKALVQLKRAKTVVAETQKARGAAVRIAVAPGEYEVLVRQGNRLLRCPVMAPGAVDLGRCSSEAYVEANRKGPGGAAPVWRATVGLALGGETRDAFTKTLENFGFTEEIGPASSLSLSIVRGYRLSHDQFTFEVGGMLEHIAAPGWSRDTDLEPLRFSWSTTQIGPSAGIRVRSEGGGLYLATGGYAGLGIGRTQFVDQMNVTTKDTYLGPAIGAHLGVGGMTRWGLMMGLTGHFSYAPVIDNEIGDTHASGGAYFGFEIGYSQGGSR